MYMCVYIYIYIYIYVYVYTCVHIYTHMYTRYTDTRNNLYNMIYYTKHLRGALPRAGLPRPGRRLRAQHARARPAPGHGRAQLGARNSKHITTTLTYHATIVV